MIGFCNIHNQPMTERESKTKFDEMGQPKVYFAHEDAQGKLCFGKPMGHTQSNSTPPETPAPRKEADADWDAIARGKVRCQVAVAFIDKGEGLSEITISNMNDWVDWIMTGK